MREIVVLQHHDCETLGTIAAALEKTGLTWTDVRSYRKEPVPRDMSGAAGLIVLGGPLSVNAQERYPFLHEEMTLIDAALRAGKPVLGICLGSQLLAAALGSRVTKGRQREIGWLPVYLTPFARNDAPFHEAPDSFVTCVWHGDIFDLPHGAVPLAYSAQTDCQAFRYADGVYGLLFHLEVTADLVACAVQTFAAQLAEAKIDKAQCIRESAEYVPQVRQVAEKVFANWARLCAK